MLNWDEYGKEEAKLGRKMGHIVEFTKFNN